MSNLIAPDTIPRSADHLINSAPVTISSDWKDSLLLLAEWSARQVYWRSPWIRATVKRLRSSRRQQSQICERGELKAHLQRIGVRSDALIMAHTSVQGLVLTDGPDSNPMKNPLQVAKCLVGDLIELIGENGTLVMPTHPHYPCLDPAQQSGESKCLPIYDPKSTPGSVGLANELFWRVFHAQRSLFPHNTLAARGPLADSLLRDHLNDTKPLPHGIYSGYHRFCRQNGLLVSIGTPLATCFTLVHAAEEARDESWPIKDFFEDNKYIVRTEGTSREVTIRKIRPQYMMFSLCIRKLRRDLLRAGILHEGMVGSVRVDSAWSGELFNFLMDRNRNSTYPFFFTTLVPRK